MMKKKVIMGPYEWNDEQNCWISLTPKVGEGEIRLIDAVLCYSEKIRIYYDQEKYDIITQRDTEYYECMAWRPVGSHHIE